MEKKVSEKARSSKIGCVEGSMVGKLGILIQENLLFGDYWAMRMTFLEPYQLPKNQSTDFENWGSK